MFHIFTNKGLIHLFDNIKCIIIDGCYIGQIDLLQNRDVHEVQTDAFPSLVNGDGVDKPVLDAFDA